MRTIPFFQLFLWLLLISLLTLVLDIFALLKYPKSALYLITNPISFGLFRSGQTIGNQFYFIYAARYAAKENKAMQEQVIHLLSENADLRRKLTEKDALLSQSLSLDPKTYNLLPARPIGLERYLLLDRGKNSGVKVGQAVIFKDNFIGRIVSVSEKGASVRLSKDPDSKIAAFSLDKDGRARGVLVGQFGQEMILDKILHQEKIFEGDLVYSEGLEVSLPRGLILGKVEQVLERENEIFKQAKVSQLFDLRDLELVFIILE